MAAPIAVLESTQIAARQSFCTCSTLPPLRGDSSTALHDNTYLYKDLRAKFKCNRLNILVIAISNFSSMQRPVTVKSS